MVQRIQIRLAPAESLDERTLLRRCANHLGISPAKINGVQRIRESIDARGRQVMIQLMVDVYVDEPPVPRALTIPQYKDVSQAKEILVIGAGPAGLFAALRLIELGLKPIVLERGKDVRARRRDLAAITKNGTVNPESNYCFGEGGAGTYSDGKLYTRSTKRGDVQRILDIFYQHGADERILYEAHPHIGTNKLPQIITAIRERIVEYGGEVHFNTKVTGFSIEGDSLKGVETTNGIFYSDAAILATGHSARDIFELLYGQGIEIEAKPFALGVRIEHPQQLIDSIQYHCDSRGEYLPPASYSLVQQARGRGVFSFCMCPGGIIAPAMTAPNEMVVNGWSPSKRNNPYANSGMVVSVGDDDFKPFAKYGALAGMYYQQAVEQLAFEKGGSNLQAPAQRIVDFVEGKLSSSLPDCSYFPGIHSTMLQEVLPSAVSTRLKEALVTFGKKMKGYYTNEAVLVGVESRTSTPVRIPRDNTILQHPQIKGLYPCGEGAGYAGGIVSAAMDGENCAVAIGNAVK